MNCKHKGDLISTQEKVACEGIEGVNITRPSYKCTLHGRCIVAYNPKGKMLEHWKERYESKLFTLCCHCPDRTLPVSQNDNSEK